MMLRAFQNKTLLTTKTVLQLFHKKNPNPSHKLNQGKSTTRTLNPKPTMSTTNNTITAAILQ
jgi:hypothetical protein